MKTWIFASLAVITLVAGYTAAAHDGSFTTMNERVTPTPVPSAAPGELALTPPMGWNSWNTFGENINEQLILDTIDALVSSGMRDAGFLYVGLDDGWQRYKGSRTQHPLEYDPVKFPHGIAYLADYAHARGLKLGIYSGPGHETCAGYTGSLSHEQEDAALFASWGVDFLKYDSCCEPGENAPDIKERHLAMSSALRATGRPVVLHICHCGWDDVWTWARSMGGQQWRIGQDISDDFDYPGNREDYFFDVLDMIDRGVGLEQYAGPGGWNDYDMLIVGVNGAGNIPGDGATAREYRTHFSMWSILDSPLLAGTDVRTMDEYTRQTLTNTEVIALNQDPLGIQAARVRDEGDFQVFAKPLADGSWGIALLNRSTSDHTMTVEWQADLKVAWNTAQVRDLWQHADLGVFAQQYSVTVLAHEAVMLRVYPQ